MTTKCSKK